jgi:hypothetical protein
MAPTQRSSPELAGFNKHAGAHYPHHLKIVIANFDEDYPETQVFIPSTKEVFHVRPHDPADQAIDADMQKGEYVVGQEQEYDSQKIEGLSATILRYGISRKIDLAGG